MLRLFVALPIAEEAVEIFLGLQGGLPGARWQPEENLHLTLVFLGDVQEPDTEELIQALADLPTGPVPLHPKEIAAFGRPHQPRSLVVLLEQSAELMALQGRVERTARALGLEPETRKFTPHVTLGRCGRNVDGPDMERWLTTHIGAALPDWVAEEMIVYSSITRPEGSLYREEAIYPLF